MRPPAERFYAALRLPVVALLLLVAAPASAQRVSIILDDINTGVTSEEYARRWDFERMGYITRVYWSSTAQSSYDFHATTNLADVWYVPQMVDPATLADKMRLFERGVIFEGSAFDAAFGVSASDGASTAGTTFDSLTAAHPVTANTGVGAITAYTASGPLSTITTPLAAGATRLGDVGGAPALAAIDAGGVLANTVRSNSVASGKRLRLPIGGGDTDWRTVSDATLRLLEDSIDWAADYTPSPDSRMIVLVTDENGTLNDQERWRARRLLQWDFAVVLLWDGDTQANYDAAVAAADAVYVSATCDPAEVGHKLRTAACGVVTELAELDDEFGYSTIDGSYSDSSSIIVRDRSHPVSASFTFEDIGATMFHDYSYENVNFPGYAQPISLVAGTAATGLRELADRFDSTALAIVEAGDPLANTHSGNDTAAGSRVRLPWGGNSLDIRHQLSWGQGATLLYNALRWASGANAGTLIAHYRLDETSGTTAADSSGNGYDGEYRGGVTQNITPAPRAQAANFDSDGEYVFAPTNSDFANLNGPDEDFTVAFWFRPLDVSHSTWRNLFHIGGASSSDRGPLIMLHPTLRRVYAWVSTDAIPSGESRATAAEFDDHEWAHLTLVKSGQSLRWYVNGDFDTSGILTGRTVVTAGDLRIGRESWWGSADSDLDDVRVYDYALSDQEIAELHADLMLHYKLDDGSGTTALDSSVYGSDGALEGSPTWLSNAAIDGGLDFETSDGDDLVRGQTLDVGGSHMTIAIWFNQETATNDARLLMNSGGTASSQQTWGLTVDENGELDFRVQAGGTWDRVQAPGVVSPGAWRHATGVYDGTEMRLYLDGALIAQKNHSVGGDMTYTPANVVTLGDAPSGGRSFDGQLDDARVYKRVLSDEEIFELGGSGLRLHLRFDETSGTTAEDSSPFGRHATFATGSLQSTDAILADGFRFDGVDDVLRTDETFDPPATGAVAFWMRRTTDPAGTQRLFGVSGDWEVRQDADGVLTFDLGVSPFTGQDDFSTNEPIGTDHRWHHVVANFDAADDSYEIYIDGQLHRVDTHARDLVQQSAGFLSIGDRTGAGEPYAGDLDDLRVYNRQLTAEEVADLYGLIGHWRLDEVAGATVVTDETVFGQDGEYLETPALEEESPYPSNAVRTAVRFEPGDYVQVPAANHLEVGNQNADFSVAYWLQNHRESSGQWREVVKKHSSGHRRTFAMWLYPHDERMYFPISTTNYFSEGAYSVTEFDVGVWRHVAYVKEGSQLKLYVDGVLDATRTLNGSTVSNNGAIRFGVRSTSWRSDVSIDDFRLYSRALNDWEVAELHGLVGRWKLDDPSGTVAVDSSGMQRDGTYFGNPTLYTDGPEPGTYAAEFDGLDDLVQLASFYEDYTQGVSISAWAKPTNAGDSNRFLNVSEGFTRYLALGRRNTEDSLYGIGGTGFGVEDSLHEDVWRHYTMSVDDTGLMRLYRNGVHIGESSVTLPEAGQRTTNSIGGTLTGGSEAPFTGRLYDVRIYNRPVSRDEARALYYGDATPGLRIVRWVEMPNP